MKVELHCVAFLVLAFKYVYFLSFAAGKRFFNIDISLIYLRKSVYALKYVFIAKLNWWLSHPMKQHFTFPANDRFIEQLSPIRAATLDQSLSYNSRIYSKYAICASALKDSSSVKGANERRTLLYPNSVLSFGYVANYAQVVSLTNSPTIKNKTKSAWKQSGNLFHNRCS